MLGAGPYTLISYAHFSVGAHDHDIYDKTNFLLLPCSCAIQHHFHSIQFIKHMLTREVIVSSHKTYIIITHHRLDYKSISCFENRLKSILLLSK
jgi:hypothetical protein